METEQFPIDDVIPVDHAHLIEDQNRLILQHGGVVTRVFFNKVSRMPLDHYLKHELPSADGKTKCHLIRDYNHNNITMILDDHVAVYDVVSIEDVPLRELANNLITTQNMELFPNIPYQIIGYIKQQDCLLLTVHIPASWFYYRSAEIESLKVMHPPLWFRVKLNNAGSLLSAAMVVVRTTEARWEATKLYRWILPNVFPNNEICLGGSQLSGGITDPTYGQIIMSVYHQVFDSLWNYHLFDQDTVDKAAREAFDALSGNKIPFTSPLSGIGSTASLKRILSVLHQPEGWRQIKWPDNQYTADEFVRGKGGR